MERHWEQRKGSPSTRTLPNHSGNHDPQFTEDGDLETAVTRLDSLGPNGSEHLFSLMLDRILAGGDAAESLQLVQLAAALGFTSPAMQPYLPEPPP